MIKALLANIYMFKVKNRHTKKWRQILNFEHISHNFLVFYVVDFEYINVCWVTKF